MLRRVVWRKASKAQGRLRGIPVHLSGRMRGYSAERVRLSGCADHLLTCVDTVLSECGLGRAYHLARVDTMLSGCS